jgi:hypothetical protein
MRKRDALDAFVWAEELMDHAAAAAAAAAVVVQGMAGRSRDPALAEVHRHYHWT